MVKLLIENGANVNAVNQDGQNALMLVTANRGKGNLFTTHACKHAAQ